MLLKLESDAFKDVLLGLADKDRGSQGNLAMGSIKIDERRDAPGVFEPGDFRWQIVHELMHFYVSLVVMKDEKLRAKYSVKDGDDADVVTIRVTNIVMEEMGIDWCRDESHDVEEFENRKTGERVEIDEKGKIGKVLKPPRKEGDKKDE